MWQSQSKSVIKPEVLRDQARRGGKAEKRDALQREIEEIVKHTPSITTPGLLKCLKDRCPGPLLIEIDETQNEILFNAGPVDRIKTAAITGLKDRRMRARQSLRCRK